jgi:alkanesulfonate monooxygenase SsuD/methylene tetrahydromethanopterin reductase-like flavin-dependent oxidoreductase (luciferase family)
VIIGVGLDARLQLPFPELRQAGREAARLGFESLWTPAGGIPDAFHVCAAWSQDTHLRTGISVVPAVRMWTPLALATQAATVGQLSDGRFVLGLGTGGYGPTFWQSMGLPDRPIAVMDEYVTVVRQLLAGETVSFEGAAVRVQNASLGSPKLPHVPVYLAALGPQMLRLAGAKADGALLNWATPQRIAESRDLVAVGADRSERPASDVPLTMYIRVCVDDDVSAARRALGTQVLGYALGRSGVPNTAGYRGLFGQMGFDDVLSELEARRSAGTPMVELVDSTPDDLLTAVGYFGSAEGAPDAYARLSQGLDETVVRIVTARPGLEPVVSAMEALTPQAIRTALARHT